MEHVFDPNRTSPTSPSFPHAFSGNPGGIRTGPPIKTFGGDDFGVALFAPAAIFKGAHEGHEEIKSIAPAGRKNQRLGSPQSLS